MSQVSLLKKKISVAILFLACPLMTKAQADSTRSMKIIPIPTDMVSLGMGMGLDYGGIGMNVTIYPQKNIGFFGGIGYALIGLGYNAGFKARIHFSDLKPSSSIFMTGIYGYNTVYKVKNASRFNKMFYGATIGLGFETAVKPGKAGYWSFGLLIPLRSTEAIGYQDELESIPNMKIEQKLVPVAFSIGYRFMMHQAGAPKPVK
jgi:hypothetical protein